MTDDLQLCDRCGIEQALHVGYDHGAGKCLVASRWLDLALMHGEEKAKEIIRIVIARREANKDKGAEI